LKKKRLSRIAALVLLAFVTSLCFQGILQPVFARAGPEDADIELFIHGEKSNGGAIFNTSGNIGDALWAPGVSDSGIMRIYNNYSNRVSIHNLGIKLKLHNTITDKAVTDSALIEEYAEAMQLTIKKGQFLIFEKTIYDKSFYEMLYNKDNPSQRGYELGVTDRINIGKDDSVDLQYTVKMAESAGNNLQGLKATVDFIVNLQENPYEDQPDDDDDDDDDRDDRIEEPVIKIPDVGGHWAHDCIIALIENDVLVPNPNGSVRPEDYITRAEAAVLIGKALKLEESKAISTGYVDYVPTWARGYVIATTEAKVFKGYPGRVFKANNNITREEMTAVLIRAFRENSNSDSPLNFTDSDEIAKWARGNVAKSVDEGIVTGYTDNTFRPKNYMTRAEAFTIVCKLLGYHEQHNKRLSSGQKYISHEGGDLIE